MSLASRLRIHVYTAYPPKPDLLAESGTRAETARETARALGPVRAVTDTTEHATAAWPDPHGPDVTVFGPRRPRFSD
jgi:hypothetical protein